MSRKVALVTGASRGIGRAIAVELARADLRVAVGYRSDVEGAKETVALIEDIGGEAIPVQADVSIKDDVDRCFDEVEDRLGPVGVLVNNAGLRADGLAVSLSDESWNRVIGTNLYGAFACSRRALRSMLSERWGRIVNVSSVAGLKGSPGQVAYSASKAGLIGLTKTLAREVGRRNITVNAIAPGLVETELIEDLTDAQKKLLVEGTTLERPGTPEEVAHAVAYLCSENAAYTNGTVLTIDAGLTA